VSNNHPLIIAHRAGNRLELIEGAARSGADLIEIDVWFHRGQVEVGHTKTLGPLPVLWDRWELAFGWRRPLLLADVLPRIPRTIEVYYDLKGTDARLSPAVLALAEEHRPGEPRMVSSQTWGHLDHFRDDPLTSGLRSVGSRSMLAPLAEGQRSWAGAGVAVHAKLVTPELVAEARGRAPLFFSWPVNDLGRARALARAGVNGLISDDLPAIRSLWGDAAGS
jgi:glycerophosphoryl diester phosphodiesterase